MDSRYSYLGGYSSLDFEIDWIVADEYERAWILFLLEQCPTYVRKKALKKYFDELLPF